MTQSLTISDSGAERSHSRDRSGVIEAARSHSRRVRLLKRGIIAGAAGAIAVLLGITFVDPFSNVPANVSIASASLSGTRIIMELPKLNGFRKDGKPYQVRARSGVQDVRSPKIVELDEVEAQIQVENDNIVNVIAPFGVFDSGSDLMKLSARKSEESISLKSTSGFTVILRTADVNLKSGSLSSSDPVSVRMPNGTVTADRVDVGDGGKLITFNGNVRSLFKSPDSESGSGAN